MAEKCERAEQQKSFIFVEFEHFWHRILCHGKEIKENAENR